VATQAAGRHLLRASVPPIVGLQDQVSLI